MLGIGKIATFTHGESHALRKSSIKFFLGAASYVDIVLVNDDALDVDIVAVDNGGDVRG